MKFNYEEITLGLKGVSKGYNFKCFGFDSCLNDQQTLSLNTRLVYLVSMEDNNENLLSEKDDKCIKEISSRFGYPVIVLKITSTRIAEQIVQAKKQLISIVSEDRLA